MPSVAVLSGYILPDGAVSRSGKRLGSALVSHLGHLAVSLCF